VNGAKLPIGGHASEHTLDFLMSLGRATRIPLRDAQFLSWAAIRSWRRTMNGSSYMAAIIALRHGLSAEDKGLGAIKRALANCHAYLIAAAIVLFGPTLLSQPASARFNFSQQGPKLVGTGAVGAAQQGSSVAVSADGNTAVIGGPQDNSQVGAAWAFTRSNGVWTQQGQKLVGTGAILTPAGQGISVALSADGNTALVGGNGDNGGAGAAWVFTRSNGVWTQQGNKLVGTGAINIPDAARQGSSVVLSADGNTAVIGGLGDNSFAGAAWVFTRSNGVWTQQGQKLVGTGAVGGAQQGASVALSGDGNTAVIGGTGDNGFTGATWVFTLSNGVWTQQGNKLVGTGTVGAAQQGHSVALSGDGNTAVIGGPQDTSQVGAAWAFTRSIGVWTQQGQKLVGTGAVGVALQGASVALSSDGNTAVIGGPDDNCSAGVCPGAAWVFTRSNGVWTQQGNKLVGTGAVPGLALEGNSAAMSGDGNTAIIGGNRDNSDVGAAWVFFADRSAHDFNGDGASDIAWRDTSGNAAAWLMTGAQLLQAGGFGAIPTNWTIVGQRDFNGDSKADLLWRDGNTGTVAIWLLNGLQISQAGSLGAVPGNWSIVGTGDFNGDGKGDILWRDSTTGTVAIWLVNGLQILQAGSLGAVPSTSTIVGVADFNGDGMADILWRDTSGNVTIWLVNGLQILQVGGPGQVATTWSVIGTGDFNGDGKADILWRDADGDVAVWLMDGLEIAGFGALGMVPFNWSVAETGDFNGDGKADILWRDTNSGAAAISFMNGVQISQTTSVGTVSLSWTIQGLNAD
jgi:hypothetical protein